MMNLTIYFMLQKRGPANNQIKQKKISRMKHRVKKYDKQRREGMRHKGYKEEV